MAFWSKLFTKTETLNPGASLSVLHEFSNLLLLNENYSSLAKTGYTENVIVNTCIKRISQAINSIPIEFFVDGEKVDPKTSDKLIKSIIRAFKDPNPDYDKNLFIESIYSYRQIDGDSYIYIPEDSLNNVAGFKLMRPDKVTHTQSASERVRQYRFSNGSEQFIFNRDNYLINGFREENPTSLEGRFNMVIMKNFNPLRQIDGLSALSSAGLSIDGHNSALKWNNEVMKNSGKISGLLSFGGPDGGGLSGDQIKQLTQKIKSQTTGSNNGSILISNNPGKFDKFAMTSQEMDFIQGSVQRATDICNALGYPPYLLGFTGATFSNQDAAKLSLYEDTAIPEANKIYGQLATFLSRKYDIDFEIKLDVSKVAAMAPRFKEQSDNIGNQFKNNIINQEEAREKLGYEKLDATSELFFSDFSRTAQVDPNQET